jgi:hypothetical protein
MHRDAEVIPRKNPTYEQLHIHRWAAENRLSVGLAISAHQLATAAEWAYLILEAHRARRLSPLWPVRPSYPQWPSYYRDHRTVHEATGNAFPSLWGNGSATLFAADLYRSVQRQVVASPDACRASLGALGDATLRKWWHRGLRWGRKTYRAHLIEMQATFLSEPGGAGDAGDAEDAAFEAALAAHPAAHFFTQSSCRASRATGSCPPS